MSLLDRIAEARHPRSEWPGGRGASAFEGPHGHDDDRFSPESYGDYLATSNEIFSAISLRARAMSRLRLQLFRGQGPDRQEITAGPVNTLTESVNPFWTWRRLQRMDEMCMCLWGETAWALEPGLNGEPKNIWWLKPTRLRPVVHESRYLSGFLYHPADGSSPLPFTTDEIVWFRYPNPIDEFSPLSPLAAARLAADTGSAMMQANRNLFRNGLALAGLVLPATDKVTFTSEQASDLERDLALRFTGADKRHRWAVLRYEAQFKSLEVSPKDAEFVSGLDLTLRQVGNAFGIPAPLLNDLAHATLANTREFERILWENTLVPDAGLRSDEIQEQLLPRFRNRVDHCEFDFSAIAALQESATESWTREAQAIDRGAITINEWRKSKGMPAVDWGDVPWMAVNKAPVDPETGLLHVDNRDLEPAFDPAAARGRRLVLDALSLPALT
jgi:HK97 family phage portal protein